MAQSPCCHHWHDEPGDNSQLSGGQGDPTGNWTGSCGDIVTVTGPSLVALGQQGLVGVVDATVHDLGRHQLGSGKPGIGGGLVGSVVFDTDPLVETRCSQIDDVHAPMVLPPRWQEQLNWDFWTRGVGKTLILRSERGW